MSEPPKLTECSSVSSLPSPRSPSLSSSSYPSPISVNDKLPPYGEVVLAFYDGGWHFASWHVNARGDTWWWADAYTGYELQFAVTHWMHCPPDPK